MSKNPICEVRVPTYRRPDMLRRALQSLCAQTETRWRALVFDDSPYQEASRIIKELADNRILYSPNPFNLGASANLDQTFRAGAYLNADYAFVLEDDNFVYPSFIEENIREISEEKGAQLLIRNQFVGLDSSAMSYQLTGQTTRGDIFENGLIGILELYASLFFCEGISNGGLFWRIDSSSDLSVGPAVVSAALQEHLRTLQIDAPILFALEPLAIFSLPTDNGSLREPLKNRKYARARQAILRRLVRKHGSALIDAAYSLARTEIMRRKLKKELADALIWPHFLADIPHSLKGLAKIAFVDDPLSDYWRITDQGLKSAR
jgi:glycosyltransferase involved in cell wall biosynthesis